jgi:hypothetical protein
MNSLEDLESVPPRRPSSIEQLKLPLLFLTCRLLVSSLFSNNVLLLLLLYEVRSSSSAISPLISSSASKSLRFFLEVEADKKAQNSLWVPPNHTTPNAWSSILCPDESSLTRIKEIRVRRTNFFNSCYKPLHRFVWKFFTGEKFSG